ncbi:uncharacterized protein LOC143259977 [Megalopta genalis]|uniref:uncharacterized protein LOC143259977 n=1 Tax=Megalopta genalis TaxID=115081 RepID=UPI003FCF5769
MKCIAAFVLLAIFAVAFAEEKPAEPKKLEPVVADAAPDASRDKRGVLLNYAAAPIAYSAYSAPLTYSSAYSLPYAYRAYPPYYPSYYNSYIYG